MAQERRSLAPLWDLLRETGLQQLAPVLLRHGVRSPDDVVSQSGHFLTKGVSQWQLELLIRGTVSNAVGDQPARRRWDLPVSRPKKRASMQLALQAAGPSHRQQALAALDESILAPTTAAAADSRVRTYQEICKAWAVTDFPISYDSLRCFAASLKAGGYRSSSLYFHTIFGHQQRRLAVVDPYLKQVARDFDRSITRGMGPSQLKDSFDVHSLTQLSIPASHEPFDVTNVSHSRDVCLLASWFMLREIEVAGACHSHLYITGSVVNMLIPLDKTDQVGSLTIRSLKCACRVRSQPLCPVHAALRHLQRLALHPRNHRQAQFPLVPTSSGEVLTKSQTIEMFRNTIASANISTVRHDEAGQPVQRFHGHVMRVSGAQMLSRAGATVPQIQLLGRWSSHSVERYIQLAPLQTLPSLAPRLLNAEPAVDPATALRCADQQVSASCLAVGAEILGSDEPSKIRQELEAVKGELSILKGSLVEQDTVYLHRRGSVIVHQGDADERANRPATWKTRCGWPYAFSSFFRLSSISGNFRKCRRCFRSEAGQDDTNQEELASDHADHSDSHPDCSSSSSE